MSTISRRKMLQVLGAGVAGGLAWSGCATAAPRVPKSKPNIVFILADDLGYGDLGCYGQRMIKTPHLDAMAAEGIRFTQCYAGSTVCAPSRCALMTGMHMGHAFIRGNARIPLRPGDTTVAETLKKAGYATGLVGKWGLGEPDTTGVPNRKGFDEFFGYLNQNHAHNTYPTYLWRNTTRVPIEGNTERPDKPGVCAECKTFSNDLFTEEALSFIERHKNGPFFLYLAYTIPHANNEKGAATGDGMEVPDYGEYANKPWPNPQKGKAALISRLDRDVGRLLAKLRELGLDENTIVFFTSDNGPHKEGGAPPEFFQSSGPLRGIKRDLYEGGIRVPMIARWPGVVPRGRSDQVWAFWDFLPTAAELAGVPAPQGLDGRSALPLLLGETKQIHEFLYWEFHERGFTRAVRMGDWKAVSLGKDQPLELYDLSKDIGEKNNVASDHPKIVERIEKYLKSARTISEHWPVK
ncbi:MAG TPA: arylsulfatase [Candidatus Hydrogenedentes bacterium]|nr:arylsulfatase [Candidatus Hydrogenedentota bacterium]